jgi:hypothetical protein
VGDPRRRWGVAPEEQSLQTRQSPCHVGSTFRDAVSGLRGTPWKLRWMEDSLQPVPQQALELARADQRPHRAYATHRTTVDKDVRWRDLPVGDLG